MDINLTSLRINPDRFRADFEALALIGATSDGGVHRPALGDAHLAARAWFQGRIEAAGLDFRSDGAGNHSAALACGPAGAPTLLLGSHLDSVPYGGRFDGPLGVLAALEVLRTVQDAGVSLPVNLEAIDFTDEEGTLVGELGSGALAGHLTAEVLASPRSGRAALEAGLARAGLGQRPAPVPDPPDRGGDSGSPARPGLAGGLPGTAHRAGRAAGRSWGGHRGGDQHRRHQLRLADLSRPGGPRRDDAGRGAARRGPGGQRLCPGGSRDRDELSRLHGQRR